MTGHRDSFLLGWLPTPACRPHRPTPAPYALCNAHSGLADPQSDMDIVGSQRMAQTLWVVASAISWAIPDRDPPFVSILPIATSSLFDQAGNR